MNLNSPETSAGWRKNLPHIVLRDVESADLSRRSLLHAIATTIVTAATPIGWADLAQIIAKAHATSQAVGRAKHTFLTAAEAMDVDAVVAQIVPTDDTPGAREAGVVDFIDRALATFFSQIAGDYRAQLAAFQVTYRERHPAAVSFAALTSEQQIAVLTSVDQTPFFNTTRLLTLLGMFCLPAYGGNRDGMGWKLIGFEDAHVFTPPFGFYDRDYPGFVTEPTNGK
jgi:gluconate 2-dehydrogenase gamma chain